MAIQGLDHLAIRVNDLDAAIEGYKKIGFKLDKIIETPTIGKQAIFRMPNGTFIELVAATDPNSAVGQALEKRGEGVHSVIFTTDDFDQTIGEMKDNGAHVIVSEELAGNAFVHPKTANGVLVQIQQKK